MSIVIINPNSTTSMTAAMLQVAKESAPNMQFEGWTSDKGPPAIQGAKDGAKATPHLLNLVEKASKNGVDGIIIGCFDDTALVEAAAIASCPVIGIGQATFHFAALRNWRFSVVTTMAASVPVIERNIQSLGLTDFAEKVRASNVPVLDLEAAPGASEDIILEEARRAESEDEIDAVVLGCAGMVNLWSKVDHAIGLHVLDPVRISATCMTWLVS